MTTLRKLYQEYKDKKEKALYSVGVVGIRDVSNLSVDGVSPFNIADHIELPAFTLKNVYDLYNQHTQETNQPFTNEAIQLVFKETSGQPWLVNRIANIATSNKTGTIDPISIEDINKAIQILLKEKNDHFKNLSEKLNLYKTAFYNIVQNDVEYDPEDYNQSWLKQYGLIKHIDDNAKVANEIYKKRFFKLELTQSDQSKPMVFLCYAKEDISHVRDVYEKLKIADITPWFDEVNILPGHNWNIQIKKAMEKTDFALIFLSKQSVKKQGYVNKEIKWALDRQAEKTEEDIFLIPVKIDDCDLPYSLSSYRAVNLFEHVGIEMVLNVIHTQSKNKHEAKKELESLSENKSESSDIKSDQKRKIFISYCNEDKQWLDELLNYIQPLEYDGVEYWYKKHENTYSDSEVQKAIDDSQVFICLISNSYLGSSTIRKKELPEIIKTKKLIIPILISQCAWKLVPWLKNLQLFPKDLVPLIKKNHEEQAEILVDVVNEIGEI